MITDNLIISALKVVAEKFGIEQAKEVERVFRNETKHFKSGGFEKTLSPGMEAFGETSPWGWKVAIGYWLVNTKYAPTEIIPLVENSSGMMESRGERKFLKFASLEASMMTVAYILHSRGGDGGSWFSVTDAAQRLKYNDYLKQIIPHFTNKM